MGVFWNAFWFKDCWLFTTCVKPNWICCRLCWISPRVPVIWGIFWPVVISSRRGIQGTMFITAGGKENNPVVGLLKGCDPWFWLFCWLLFWLVGVLFWVAFELVWLWGLVFSVNKGIRVGYFAICTKVFKPKAKPPISGKYSVKALAFNCWR